MERPASKWTGTSSAKQNDMEAPVTKWTETEAPKVKPVKTITSLAGFSIGDKVVHDRFGEGVIISLEGRDNDAKASVDFTNTGTKQLLLKYAKLKLLP
jgi:DNA helicase-2/ATP-dependent DNA helicase PcrA